MSRITVVDLKSEIEMVNKLLVGGSSGHSYKYQHRNGYHAVDLMKGDQCVRCMDCGETPRVLINKLFDDYKFYLNNKD